jgi:hypothetical protein
MWIWYTETNSIQCQLPCLTLEVVNIGGKLKVIADGAVNQLRDYPMAPQNLGELLIYLDKWLEEHGLTASGMIGYECQYLLQEKLDWVRDSGEIAGEIRGESLVFAIAAGNTQKFLPNNIIQNGSSPHQPKNYFLIDEETIEGVNKLVRGGLEIRQKLSSPHLVVAARLPVSVHDDLIKSWLYSVQNLCPQGFLLKSQNWDLISCTPERFITITNAQLQVQIMAGTFKTGTDFDEISLMDEHLSARNALCSTLEGLVGKLEMTVNCELSAFGEITHFHSAFTKPYESDRSMLWTLAYLTPSPAAGTQDSKIQSAIQQLEGNTRGYYGGCFFLRTPGCLESLVSIRSIFKLKNSPVGEMIVGVGLKKGSTLSSESAEIISKATNCANLLGIKLGK